MEPKKLKPFSLFLYSVFSDYILFKQVMTKTLYTNYKASGIFFFLAMIVLILLMCLVPKDTKKRLVETKFLKIIVGLGAIIELILLLTISINVIVNVFYYNKYRVVFMVVLIITIFIISNLSLSEIINLSASFYIFLPILYLISLFFLPGLNLLELANVKFGLIEPILLINVVLSGMYLFLNEDVNKTSIILGGISGTILLMVEYIILISIAGTSFFNNYDYLGFVTYNILVPNKYIGSFDFVTIISIAVCTIFCGAYFLRLTPICFKNKFINKKVIAVALFVICGYLTAHLEVFNRSLYYLIFVQTIIFTLFYLYMVVSQFGKNHRRI